MIEFILVLCLLGFCVGSFLNVVIDRLPRGESIIKNRSHCESCRKILKWHDLIPVLSFIFLKGKCRYCDSPISVQYPVVELITGVLFVGVIRVIGGIDETGGIWVLGYYLFIISSFIAIFFIDLKHGIIPDKIIFLSILAFLAYQALIHDSLFIIHLYSGLGALLFFIIIFLFTKGRGMGFGDVKLVFLMGLVLGFPKIIVSLYLAFLTGAVVSLILIMLRKKKLKGGTIPFGPFLVFGTWTGMFLGDKIIKIVVGLV